MFTKGKHIILFVIFLFSFLAVSFGEGTKQVSPTPSDRADLQFNRTSVGSSHFAWYGATDTTDFLYIHIKDHTTEVVHMGFTYRTASSGSNIHYFRIKDSSGTTVYGPVQVSNSGEGYITSHAAAVAGPQELGNSGGYNAWTFDPTSNGDFYIEFNRGVNGNNSTGTGDDSDGNLQWWDITVADGPTTIANQIDGRVWSYNWGFNCGSYTIPFLAEMYIYSSSDSIVTNVDMNGVEPWMFKILSTSYGVANTGNFISDRQSVNGIVENPEYRVFLNDPDENVYPSTARGRTTADFLSLTGCGTDYCFNIDYI